MTSYLKVHYSVDTSETLPATANVCVRNDYSPKLFFHTEMSSSLCSLIAKLKIRVKTPSYQEFVTQPMTSLFY